MANGECQIRRKHGYRTTGWGRRSHLIQYLLQMIGVGAEEYNTNKIENTEIAAIAGTVMVPWVVMSCIAYALSLIHI